MALCKARLFKFAIGNEERAMTMWYQANSGVWARGGGGLFGRAAAAAALAAALATGCGANETDAKGPTCSGEMQTTDGEIADTGQKLNTACVSFGGYGAPGSADFRHQIELNFIDKGIVLAI